MEFLIYFPSIDQGSLAKDPLPESIRTMEEYHEMGRPDLDPLGMGKHRQGITISEVGIGCTCTNAYCIHDCIYAITQWYRFTGELTHMLHILL